MARSILREPLIHFVVAGLILFGLNQLFFGQPSQTSNGTIVVDQAAVVHLVQIIVMGELLVMVVLVDMMIDMHRLILMGMVILAMGM